MRLLKVLDTLGVLFPWTDGHPAARVAKALVRSSMSDLVVAELLMTAIERRVAPAPDQTPEPIESATRAALASRPTERAFREHRPDPHLPTDDLQMPFARRRSPTDRPYLPTEDPG